MLLLFLFFSDCIRIFNPWVPKPRGGKIHSHEKSNNISHFICLREKYLQKYFHFHVCLSLRQWPYVVRPVPLPSFIMFRVPEAQPLVFMKYTILKFINPIQCHSFSNGLDFSHAKRLATCNVVVSNRIKSTPNNKLYTIELHCYCTEN